MTISIELNQALANFEKEFTEKRNVLVECFREEFQKLCMQIFEEYPQIKVFTWNQYTPYFCDGDICTFSVNDIYAGYNDSDADEDPYTLESMYCEDDVLKEYEFTLEKQEQVIGNLYEAISPFEDFMKDIFGDQAQVIITRKGAEVRDYYEHN